MLDRKGAGVSVSQPVLFRMFVMCVLTVRTHMQDIGDLLVSRALATSRSTSTSRPVNPAGYAFSG
jgi:hypothetical protein